MALHCSAARSPNGQHAETYALIPRRERCLSIPTPIHLSLAQFFLVGIIFSDLPRLRASPAQTCQALAPTHQTPPAAASLPRAETCVPSLLVCLCTVVTVSLEEEGRDAAAEVVYSRSNFEGGREREEKISVQLKGSARSKR